jgi:uncharacterized membrane protein YozB (DUF420 family)
MSAGRRTWPLVTTLVVLSAIPVTSGTLRLIEVAGGPAVMPSNNRYGTFPLPLVLHIVSAIVFALAGILQFLPRFRRRHPTWHRRAGRMLVPAGLLVAGSGLAMTLFYEAQPNSGTLLYLFRLTFGSAMAASLVLGLTSIRRRNITAHMAWMTRAYAIGLAAGTQAFTEGFSEPLFGTGVIASDLAKGAGWIINLAIAEAAIRRPTSRRTATALAQPLAAGALQ